MSHYYDINGNPISQEEAMGMLGMYNAERQVALTEHDGVKVSTVHLVIDHGGGGGLPIIFETMIFGGAYDEEQWRYASLDEARYGHRRACKLAFGSGDE